MHERLTRLNLEQRISELEADITARESNLQALEESKAAIDAELKKLKGSGANGASGLIDDRLRARLERQKNLAAKEADFLRAQLKAFEAEESESSDQPQRYAEEASKRINDLETLLAEQKKEVEALNHSLADVEKRLQQVQWQQSPLTVAGSKRSLDDEADERLGALLRKNRHLQNDVGKLQAQKAVLETEAKATAAQLKSLKLKARTRVLELRDNPTAAAEKIKQRTLDALRAENEALRKQLAGELPTTTSNNIDATTAGAAGSQDLLVPRGSLDALRLALDEKDALVASREKSLRRLRDVFAAKAAEFRDAVFSLLGWKLDFMPNGRVRATSMYYPAGGPGGSNGKDGAAGGAGPDGEEEENFILFDGEKGTMKISGGAESAFAREVRGLVEFWVEARGSVPGFMAAMTLEFWERYGDGLAEGEGEKA